MGIFNFPAESTTAMRGSLPKLSGNAAQVLSGVGTWVAGGGGGGAAEFIAGITVANYAALPDPAANSGLLAIVLASSGVWLINYHGKGIYLSDGASWLFEADYTPSISGITGTIAEFNAACSDADFSTTTHDHSGVYEPAKGTDDNFVTDAEKVVIGNTSGTNTGDQDLSALGYLGVPANSQSANYTAVLADAGKSLDHPASDANARTFTIPANSSVAYPVGTCLAFSNMTAQVLSIAITTDTMYLVDAGTTGTRSLAQYGQAVARKITSTTWQIVGRGLT